MATEYGDRYVAFDDVECSHDSPDAIKVDIEGEEIWIPKRQIHDDSEVYKDGTSGTLIMTKWIAETKGIWED